MTILTPFLKKNQHYVFIYIRCQVMLTHMHEYDDEITKNLYSMCKVS
jgi:hypothetical protein